MDCLPSMPQPWCTLLFYFPLYQLSVLYFPLYQFSFSEVFALSTLFLHFFRDRTYVIFPFLYRPFHPLWLPLSLPSSPLLSFPSTRNSGTDLAWILDLCCSLLYGSNHMLPLWPAMFSPSSDIYLVLCVHPGLHTFETFQTESESIILRYHFFFSRMKR